MGKKKKGKREQKLPLELMPQISNVVSETECTGIVPGQSMEVDELANEMSMSSTAIPPVWNDKDLKPKHSVK